ncbi:hypothetical protein CY34DRAFT_19784 [Suillus luteus UH-Slu-Lm8-n1]|uniref:DUF6533 domain-containing protein n=1 Tax=Suillus luteus UH-Slu-Lm8-n1 TaxID=930992 RepID=A0A0D0A090_9AGAM|nr:hypothetical protein CY34DRAFT_19784 [Suillus luteus UH-Slu-Lm8-n1]
MSQSNMHLHFAVAAGVVVVYDWVLTIGQEIELIWRQWWSLMTVLYLVIRYIGIPYSVAEVLPAHRNYAIGLVDRCRVSEILTIDLGPT